MKHCDGGTRIHSATSLHQSGHRHFRTADAGETDGLHLEEQAAGTETQRPASADENARLALRPREDMRDDRGELASIARRARALPELNGS